jgi:hypothetical protein
MAGLLPAGAVTCYHCVTPASGLKRFHMSWISGLLSSGLKWLERKSDHSSPVTAEMKDSCDNTKSPQRCLYRYSLRRVRFGDRIPVGARFPAPVQTGPGANPDSYKMGTESLFQGKRGRGVALTTHPHLVPRLKKQ